MKTRNLSILGLLLLATGVQAQELLKEQELPHPHTHSHYLPHVHNYQYQFDPQNAREGEEVEYCATHKRMNELENDPKWKAILDTTKILKAQAKLEETNSPKGTIYYIPIVFHVLHENGNENISDAQIVDAVEILNRDFHLENLDAANVVAAFNSSNPSAQSVPADAEIQFRLATRAPNGACFSGITRTNSALSYVTNTNQGQQQVNAVSSGNDIYQGQWQGDEYLNVFICGGIGGAAGYTYTPQFGFTGMNNGIWLLHTYIGSIGTGSPTTSRALTHEVGHWLNLQHPWGPTNNPGLSSNCNTDDGIDDTPDCWGLTSCNLSSNSCSGDNSYWGFDQIDNTENFMEYSYCSKMFTQGQVDEMRFTLETNNAGYANRDNLITTQNLAATGANGNLTLCEAAFSASRTSICVGESVDFSDDSFNAVTSRTWTFQGGTPGTSTQENPTITYDTPGIYEVELSATDGITTDVETKTSYIRVLANGGAVPILDGFEGYSSLDAITEWEVVDYGNNAEWELATTGLSSTKSAKLPNFGQSAGNFDELVSEPIDLSGITSQTGMTLSFRYSYRKRNSGNDETMKVYVSNTCGESWVARKTLTGPILGSDIVSSSWTPSAPADWVTVHMTNITSAYWVDNFRYKFEFESDGGNNIYLDNINIYAGSPSDDLVASIDEANAVDHITLYPNPTEGDVTVRFDVANSQEVNMEVVDVTGKLINTTRVNASTGANMVVLGTASMAPGMYFLKIDGSNNSLQFVVK
jgi:PKD repeat protein